MTADDLLALLTTNLPAETDPIFHSYLRTDIRRIMEGERLPLFLFLGYMVGEGDEGGGIRVNVQVNPDGTFQFYVSQGPISPRDAPLVAKFLEGMTERLKNIGPLQETPKVGDGATRCIGSDRYPYTIVEVVNARKIVLQADKVRRTDKNGMSDVQEYEITPDPNGKKVTATRRSNGSWIPVGEKHTIFVLGERERFYDFSR